MNKWRDVTHKFIEEPIQGMPRKRNGHFKPLLGLLTVVIAWFAVLMVYDRPVPMDGYRAAQEASAIEGQAKPEGHGR
jgi:hypothetical protein